MALVKYTSYLK